LGGVQACLPADPETVWVASLKPKGPTPERNRKKRRRRGIMQRTARSLQEIIEEKKIKKVGEAWKKGEK